MRLSDSKCSYKLSDLYDFENKFKSRNMLKINELNFFGSVLVILSCLVCNILLETSPLLAQEEQGIDAAIFAIKSKKYEKAILIYSDLIQAYGKYAPAYYGRALAYYNLNENAKAKSDFENAIELDINYFEAYYGLGLINLQESQNKLAISNLTKALEINPENDEVLYSRGLAYYLSSIYGNAEKDFSRAIEKNSNNASAYYGRGITNYQMKKFKDAKMDFDYFILTFGDLKEISNECKRLLNVIKIAE